MMEIFNTRVLIAVVVAAITGTLFNAAAVAIAVSPDRLALALVPGRYLVAIALCLALPFLSRQFDRPWFFIIGILWLTVAASVVAKLVHATESARPRPRYYVTLPTYFAGVMRRLLPTRTLDWVLRG